MFLIVLKPPTHDNMASVSTSSVVNESGLFDRRVAFNLDILNAEKVKKYLFSNNKGNLKWYGDFESLQELFDHILQHRSNWSKPGGHCRKLEEDGFIIRWYSDNSTMTVSEAQGDKIKRYLLHMSTKESDSNVDLSVSFADKQVDLDRANYSVNDDESRFESLLNNDNELDRTNVDNLCILLEEIRSIEERLDQKINNIALDVCKIKEADNLKSVTGSC